MKQMVRYQLGWMVLFSAFSFAVHAQEDSTQQLTFDQIYLAAEKEYGLHQELTSGLVPPGKDPDAIGHPYFMDYYSNQGRMTYRGKKYVDLNLRFDIFHQELLLIYPHKGREYKVWIHKEFLSEFTVENKRFIHQSPGSQGEQRFYQVLGKGIPVQVLYYREKGLSKVNSGDSEKSLYEERKDSFVLLENKMHEYKGNRSFTGLFSPDLSKDIKSYLRKHSVKVKNATDPEMEGLLEHISTLLPVEKR
jgi:hypothetical protein